ncbi:MAG TPA: hypothetical protein VML19_26590 [Verrucomicrobiae bacterium]|nr:hypothetical protein [Verrucomicrobiae bacterium]
MKTIVLAIAFAFATMPLTFAQNPAKPAADTSKTPKKHDTSKKPPKKGGTSKSASTTTSTPSTTKK